MSRDDTTSSDQETFSENVSVIDIMSEDEVIIFCFLYYALSIMCKNITTMPPCNNIGFERAISRVHVRRKFKYFYFRSLWDE